MPVSVTLRHSGWRRLRWSAPAPPAAGAPRPGGELDGIAEQVEHDLAQAHAIHFVRRRQLRIDLHVQRQPTCTGLGRQQAAHAFQQRPQRLRHRLQAQCVASSRE
jgi:hypothetical protein